MMDFTPIRKGGSGSYEEDAPKETPKKTPIVTKKMLADSGHDNLRDYLNAQRGLTRRKSAGSEQKPDRDNAMRKKADMVAALDTATRRMPEDTTPIARKNIAEARRKAIEAYDTAGRAEGMKAYKPRSTEIQDAKPMTRMKFQGEDYAKGGSVSRRADGIAARGKTRGKMV